MNYMRNKFNQLSSEFGYIEKRYKKGGGGGGTEYVQSPEARKMLDLMMPAIGRIGQAGGAGGTLWNVPDVPSITQAPMPTQGWFGGLDQSIQAGLLEPYQLGSKQLAEQLGASGMAGSARAGWSGTAGSALSKFWEDAAQGMGTQAWNMINPNQMAQWQLANQAAQSQWMQDLYARQAPYSMIPGMAGGSMPTPVYQQGGGKK